MVSPEFRVAASTTASAMRLSFSVNQASRDAKARRIAVSETCALGVAMEYNEIRPHSALGYRPPAPEAIMVAALT